MIQSGAGRRPFNVPRRPSGARILGGLAALALAGTAAAEDIGSANWAMPFCRSALNGGANIGTGFCTGTVGGIAFMGSHIRLESDGHLSRQSCLNLPHQVTTEQLVRVVVTYIDAWPARLHETFNLLALEALRTAWACR